MVDRKSSPQAGDTDGKKYPTGRPVVRGTQGIVSAGHYLTSIAGMRMLLDGGNAFDAVAAAGFAATVLEPTASYSLATEGCFMLYHAATGELRVLSGQGVAPGRATVDFFKQRGLDKIPTGPGPNAELAFTVPGVVDAFILMLETYGTKTLGEVMAPAIGYAQNGFPVYEYMHRKLRIPQCIEQFRRYPPGGMDVFYPGGEPVPVGEMLVQSQLAATLKKMVSAESDAGGDRLAGLRAAREMFYRGDIAATIVRCSERVGGLLTLEDLAGYHARFEEPVMTTFMGYEICAQSTWSQGAVLLQALNILERFDSRGPEALRAMGHNSTQYIHTVAEALKLAFADREGYYGDPDFARVPVDGLLSKEYAATRARLIRGDKAWPEAPEAGDPWRYAGGAPLPATVAAVTAATAPEDDGYQSEGGTTHSAAIDRDGNIVCATISGGKFDSSVFFPELGCTLSTRSEMFFVDERHPNGLQPGKRPRTTLVNYMVSKDGQPLMTFGCPGADDQAQADLQILLNVLVFGMDPQQAVEAPRFSSQSMVNSFYPRVYLPGRLSVEPGIHGDVRSDLAALGHKVVGVEACGYGAVVNQREPQTGALSAGADPRVATYAIGY